VRSFTTLGFDGQSFVASWLESYTRKRGDQSESARDLLVARIDPAAVLLESGPVAPGRERMSGGALASTGDGRALVGYGRFDTDPASLSTRAFARLLGVGACDTSTPCSDTTCDGCCARGCVSAPATLACVVAGCDAACPDGSDCVEGIGCVQGSKRPAKIVYSKGCGCRLARDSSETASVLFGVLSALGVALRRARRRR